MSFELLNFGEKDFRHILDSISSKRELIQWAGSRMFTYPLEPKQLFLYLSKAKGCRPKSYIYTLLRTDDNERIGHVELSDINQEEMSAVLSRVMIFPEHRGEGYSHNLIRAILDLAFNSLKFKEITLSVYIFNIPAIKLYEKIGFECTKITKSACVVNGEGWDSMSMHISHSMYMKYISKKDSLRIEK